MRAMTGVTNIQTYIQIVEKYTVVCGNPPGFATGGQLQSQHTKHKWNTGEGMN